MQVEVLTAAGFRPCSNPSIGPSSLIKNLKASEMPYVREHIVGTMGVTDSDTVFVEVQPDGVVTIGIEAAGYYEEVVPTDSDEGHGILRDAGVPV